MPLSNADGLNPKYKETSLDQLGMSYIKYREKGYGTLPDNRIPEQTSIVNEILLRMRPSIMIMVRYIIYHGHAPHSFYDNGNPSTLEVDWQTLTSIDPLDLFHAGLLRGHNDFGYFRIKRQDQDVDSFFRYCAFNGMKREAQSAYIMKHFGRDNEDGGPPNISLDAPDMDDSDDNEGLVREHLLSRFSGALGGGGRQFIVDTSPYRSAALNELYQAAFKNMNKRWIDIIVKTHGLGGEKACDTKQLAAEYGVRKGTIDTTIRRALERIKDNLRFHFRIGKNGTLTDLLEPEISH